MLRAVEMENKNELLCSYAALMLADAEIDVTVTNHATPNPQPSPAALSDPAATLFSLEPP